jgi:hypothetical protein
MRIEKANTLIKKMQSSLEKNGFDAEALIKDLKTLRPFAQEEEDPLVTKSLRFAYQHLEENGTFDIEIVVDEDEEGNPIKMEDADDKENMLYYLQLLLDSANEYNRNELREINPQLKL